MRSFPVFLLLFVSAISALAQKPAEAGDLDRRVERQVRAYSGAPPDARITQGTRTPSKFAGYDNLPVTIEFNGVKKTLDFLIAKNSSKLLYITEIDLSEDPYAKNMKQIDITGRPYRGAQTAPVTVVLYDDFECPFCSQMYVALFNEVMTRYRDRVKVVMKDFPILDAHPWAMRAAVDAHCLADQSLPAYWQFSDYVHTHQQEVMAKFREAGADGPKAIDTLAASSAEKSGVKPEPLQACFARQDQTPVELSMAEGRSLGVSATPTLFVNGQEIEGILSTEKIRMVLDHALAEAPTSRTGQ